MTNNTKRFRTQRMYADLVLLVRRLLEDHSISTNQLTILAPGTRKEKGTTAEEEIKLPGCDG